MDTTNEKKDELTFSDLKTGTLFKKDGSSGFFIKLENEGQACINPENGYITIYPGGGTYKSPTIVSVIQEGPGKDHYLMQMKETFHMEYLDGRLTSSKCKDRLEMLENQVSRDPEFLAKIEELKQCISNQEDTITALSDEKDEAIEESSLAQKEISSLENDLSFQKNYADSLKLTLTQLKGALNLLSK